MTRPAIATPTGAEAVDVVTDPKGTPAYHPMARDGDSGYWSCDVGGVRPADSYNFRIRNGSLYERVDAYARDVDDNDVVGLVVDPRSDWGQLWSPFATPRFDDLILYQVHVGSFAGMNDGLAVPDESADYDQFDQAARLSEARLARRLHSPEELPAAIAEALGETPERANARAFAEILRREPAEARIRSLVAAHLSPL